MARRNSKPHGVRITVLLITAMTTLVTLSTGLVLFLSERAAFRNTFELLQQSGSATIQRLEDGIRVHVSPAGRIVEHVSNLVASGELDPTDRSELITAMKAAMAGTPQVAGLVFWDSTHADLRVMRTPTGVRVLPPEAITEPQLLELIAEIRERGEQAWHDPALSRGDTYVYAAGPLVSDDRFLGVLVAGVSIKELSHFVDRVGNELGMTAFILHGDAHILAHSELKQKPLSALVTQAQPLLAIDSLEDSVLQNIEAAELDHGKIDNATLKRLKIDDERHLIISRQISLFGPTPWHIGAHLPLENIDDQVKRLVGSLLVGLGVLLLAIICAVVLARYVARPILILAGTAERIGRFELDHIEKLPHSRIRELDHQALAFNRMLDGLKWFETYVPKALVQRLIARDEDEGIPSGEMEVTVMFTDIIGFTRMTEHMAPADVAAMLNAHFEVIGTCIEEEGGTLDKYIGDAVMAFWGAPDLQADHAARACRAALRIADAMSDAHLDAVDHPPIRVKVAVHSGTLLVGNIGASRRMNYTVIGDTVNTCSRIEGLAGTLVEDGRSIILVSGDTAAQAAGAQGLAFEDAGAFEVKGRSEPVRVCRLTAV